MTQNHTNNKTSDSKHEIDSFYEKKNLTSHLILIIIQACFLFYAPLVCMDNKWYDFANLPQGLYVQSISGVMVFVWLLDCVLNKKFEIKKSLLYLPVFLILLYSGLSFFWSTNISESFEVLSQWLSCAIIFFVIYNMVNSTLDISIVLIAIVSSSFYLILIGVLQFFDPNFHKYQQVISPAATFANKNMFSDYLVIALPLSLYFLVNYTQKKLIYFQILAGFILATGILLIVFSKTRAGMVTIPVILIIFLAFLLTLKKKNNFYDEIFSAKNKLIIIGVIVFFILIASILMAKHKKEFESFSASDFSNRIKSIFKIPEDDKMAFNRNILDYDLQPVSDSTSIRLITWRNTLYMIKDRPWFGFGLYNWQSHYGEYRRAYYNDPSYRPGMVLVQVHNDYLQILADLGIVGFLLFLWFIGSLFLIFKRIFFSNDIELESRLKALSLILCVLAFGMASLFSFLIVRSTPTFLLFIYAALLGNIYFHTYLKKKSKNEVYQLNSNIAGWLILPTLMISVAVICFEVNRGKADQLYKSALDNLSQQKYIEMINDGENAIQAFPLQYEAYIVIANGYTLLNKYDKASEQIDKGLKYYPNDLLALFQGGTINLMLLNAKLDLVSRKNEDVIEIENKAIFYFERALKIRNDFSKASNNLGLVYEKKAKRLQANGELKEAALALKNAEICFDRAMIQKGYFDPLINKARILALSGQDEEAIAIGNKVISLLKIKLDEAESKIQLIISENNQNKFYDAYLKKSEALKEYLDNTPVIFGMLRSLYSKKSRFNDLFELFEKEKLLLKYELEGKAISKNISKVAFEKAQKSESEYTPERLIYLENSANDAKVAYEKAEPEYYIKFARLMILSADVNKISGDKVNFLKILNQVIELGKNRNISEQETIALLKINEEYIASLQYENSDEKILIIEENFKKAKFNERPELNEYKNQLELKFAQIKAALNVVK